MPALRFIVVLGLVSFLAISHMKAPGALQGSLLAVSAPVGPEWGGGRVGRAGGVRPAPRDRPSTPFHECGFVFG